VNYILLFVVVIYLLGTVLLGSLMSKRSQKEDDWAIAGGGMSTLVLAFAIAGGRIGGAGTYGVAESVASGGVWVMWWYGISSFLGILLVGVFFARRFRKLGIKTAGEVFKLKFNSHRCQRLTSLCVQTENAVINVIEVYVIGIILSSLTPLTMLQGSLAAAVVFATYVSFGGLWGTAITNLQHVVVMLIALSVIGVLGIREIGGWENLTASVGYQLEARSKDQEVWWGFVGGGWLAVIGMMFSAAVHSPAASIYPNYAAALENERKLPIAFFWGAVIAAVIPPLAGLIGILTFARYGLNSDLEGYQNVTAIASEINPIAGGLAIAAILAAVISSGGPILLASSTMIVRDWLGSFKSMNSATRLRAYRRVTIANAFLSALVAWWLATRTTVSLLELLLFGFAMVVPPAIALSYTFFWSKTTERGVFWGMCLGYLGGISWFALIKWSLWMDFQVSEGASLLSKTLVFLWTHNGEGVNPSFVTTLVPLVVIPVVSVWFRDPIESERSSITDY
jgi:SSS family solute:Na+ symporter